MRNKCCTPLNAHNFNPCGCETDLTKLTSILESVGCYLIDKEIIERNDPITCWLSKLVTHITDIENSGGGGGDVTWQEIYNFLNDPANFNSNAPITLIKSGSNITIGLNPAQLADFINANNMFSGAVTYNPVTKQFTFTGGGSSGPANVIAGPGITVDIVGSDAKVSYRDSAISLFDQIDLSKNIITQVLSNDSSYSIDASTLDPNVYDGQRSILRLANASSLPLIVTFEGVLGVGMEYDSALDQWSYEIPYTNIAEFEIYIYKVDTSGALKVQIVFLRSYDGDTGELTDFAGYTAIANIERVIANALSRHEVLINP